MALKKKMETLANLHEEIDDDRVGMRLACLFHYNIDLVAVHRFMTGNHMAAHREPDVILPQVKDLLPPQVFDDLERIMRFGCPAKFNEHGSHEQFQEYMAYGNHKSLTKNPIAFRKAMNKEDRRDHVVTFPSWVAPFTQY